MAADEEGKEEGKAKKNTRHETETRRQRLRGTETSDRQEIYANARQYVSKHTVLYADAATVEGGRREVTLRSVKASSLQCSPRWRLDEV